MFFLYIILLIRRYTLNKLISSLPLLTLGAVISIPAQAAIHYDSHGNVGYDTLAECQTAIQSGTARFYKPVTSDQPILRGSEVSVGTARLGNLAPEYSRGTCDIGTSGRNGRDGVAKAIQGKYVPYSPDMLINQYSDVSGNITRVTMGQCDNWFSGPLPQGMPVVADPVLVPAPIPQPVVLVPTPLAAVSAAAGSIPVWVPVVAGVAAVILLASGGDSDSSSTTGTTGTN